MAAVMRFVSLILIVIALGLIGADFVTSLERHGLIVVRSVAQVWSLFDRAGPANSVAWAQHTLPYAVAHVFEMLLNSWSWVVVGIPGIILVFLFDRRRPEQA
jgi:uncharacterized membrane protein